MTLADWLTQQRNCLSGESAAYEMRLLAEAVIGLTPTQQRIRNPKLNAHELKQLDTLLRRRQHGEPMAYILGHQPFYTLDLLVNSHTLIPRADSECLVEATLQHIPVEARTRITLADLGTGSGALALAIASVRPEIEVIATDYSAKALQVAATNCLRNNIHNVTLICADWLSPFAEHSLDIIMSNPPYIAAHDPHLAALTHEPQRALVSAQEGFADLFHLVAHAGQVLKPYGWLLLEHGYNQAEALRDYAAQFPHWHHIQTLKDYGGHERVSLMQFIG